MSPCPHEAVLEGIRAQRLLVGEALDHPVANEVLLDERAVAVVLERIGGLQSANSSAGQNFP